MIENRFTGFREIVINKHIDELKLYVRQEDFMGWLVTWILSNRIVFPDKSPSHMNITIESNFVNFIVSILTYQTGTHPIIGLTIMPTEDDENTIIGISFVQDIGKLYLDSLLQSAREYYDRSPTKES